jgi:hypothetical protein
MDESGFQQEAWYRAVDAQRQHRGLQWSDVSQETELDGLILWQLKRGCVPKLHTFCKLSSWANLNTADFVLGSVSDMLRRFGNG